MYACSQDDFLDEGEEEMESMEEEDDLDESTYEMSEMSGSDSDCEADSAGVSGWVHGRNDRLCRGSM